MVALLLKNICSFVYVTIKYNVTMTSTFEAYKNVILGMGDDQITPPPPKKKIYANVTDVA